MKVPDMRVRDFAKELDIEFDVSREKLRTLNAPEAQGSPNTQISDILQDEVYELTKLSNPKSHAAAASSGFAELEPADKNPSTSSGEGIYNAPDSSTEENCNKNYHDAYLVIHDENPCIKVHRTETLFLVDDVLRDDGAFQGVTFKGQFLEALNFLRVHAYFSDRTIPYWEARFRIYKDSPIESLLDDSRGVYRYNIKVERDSCPTEYCAPKAADTIESTSSVLSYTKYDAKQILETLYPDIAWEDYFEIHNATRNSYGGYKFYVTEPKERKPVRQTGKMSSQSRAETLAPSSLAFNLLYDALTDGKAFALWAGVEEWKPLVKFPESLPEPDMFFEAIFSMECVNQMGLGQEQIDKLCKGEVNGEPLERFHDILGNSYYLRRAYIAADGLLGRYKRSLRYENLRRLANAVFSQYDGSLLEIFYRSSHWGDAAKGLLILGIFSILGCDWFDYYAKQIEEL